MTCARVAVARRPVRAVRRGVLLVTGLVLLAAVKPWGGEAEPSAEPAPRHAPRAVVSPIAVAPRPESPISSICHESPSWRVATEGSYVGSQLREWGFVEPVAADGPSDPSIPFVVFSFTLLRALGYCAPADALGPITLEVLVFRLDDSGTSTAVAVQRETRTPAWSVAGLFSIAPPTPSSTATSPPSELVMGWPPGRYVFALRGPGLGGVWFGADVRRTTAIGPF